MLLIACGRSDVSVAVQLGWSVRNSMLQKVAAWLSKLAVRWQFRAACLMAGQLLGSSMAEAARTA